jgi:nitroreductase/FMN reductase [NAD(P)H]
VDARAEVGARALFEARFGVAPRTASGEVEPRLAALLGRRVCRRYKPDPVPEATLELVLAAAQSAPAKSDLQQYSILVVEDPAKRASIAGWIGDAWVGEAPLILVFCGDLRRGRRIGAAKGLPNANDTVDMLVNATADAALAMMMLMLAADAAGLGTCPLSVIRNRIDEVAALLELPDGVYPWAGLSLGWPAATRDVSMRLPPALVVHRDRYDDSAFEEELAAYDARRHARQPIPPRSQRHVATYGELPVCHWSDNAARQLSLRERAQFTEFLKRHGFALE